MDKDTNTLREAYNKACEAYLDALLRLWGWSRAYGFWVGDAVGETYCCGDYVLRMDEILYCVTNKVTLDVFLAYSDYNHRANSLGLHAVSLKAWCQGCPRVSELELTELERLKEDFMEQIDKLNTKY